MIVDTARGTSGALISGGEVVVATVADTPPTCPAVSFWQSLQRFADLDNLHAFFMSSSVVLTQPGCGHRCYVGIELG